MAVVKPTLYYANGTTSVFNIFGNYFGLINNTVIPDFIPAWNGTTMRWDKTQGLFLDPFPQLLDPSIWDFKRVPFPASVVGMNSSVQTGVDNLVQVIKDTPGPFALSGYSQGAIVASRTLDEVRHGRLQDRQGDLLAGVCFGNPVREAGRAWPGARTQGSWDVLGSTTGGHGCMPANQRLTNTPDWWWEFSEPDDIIGSTGDGILGRMWSAAAGLLMGFNASIPGQNLVEFLVSLIDIGDVLEVLHRTLGFTLPGVPYSGTPVLDIGHVSYPKKPPFGYSEGSPTSYLIAAKYLNDVGAAWRAKQTPAAPVTSLPTTGSTTPTGPTTTPAPNVFTWLNTLLTQGETAVNGLLAPIISATGSNPLIGELQTLIKNLPSAQTGLSSALTNIVNGLTNGTTTLTSALTQVNTLLSNSTQQLASWWTSTVQTWFQQLTTFETQSQQWIEGMLAQGQQVLNNTLNTVLTTGQHSLESVVNSFANGIAQADAGLSALMKSVVTAVNNGNATLHDAVNSLHLIANSNLFTDAAAQLQHWWDTTTQAWFKSVTDIFGLPSKSTTVDKQTPTPITDITDPSYVRLHPDVTSMVTKAAPAIPTSGPVHDVYKAITSRDPLAASEAAYQIAKAQQTPSTDILVTLYDRTYNPVGEVYDYQSLTYTFARNQIGTATMVLKHTDPMVETVMKCHAEVVPITIESGTLRWSGRVEYVDYALKDGQYEVTVYCTDDYQWFDKILCWPNFLLPIQTQIPSRALFIGPAITCIKTLIAEQAFRLQSGIWELVNNAASLNLDWRAWFGNVLESDGDPIKMLMTPIVVLPTNPLFDTSPWTSINGRMDKISTLVEQTLKDCGLVLSANLWMPGDPQPDGLIVPLYAPTIVVDVKDMSGVTGPTGTFIDGLVKDVVDIQHGVLGDTLSPFLNGTSEYAPEGINIAPALGVNFVQPWVLFHDHPRGGLREFHLIPHSPLAHSIVGGGKSPRWVNDLINATLEWFIDAIEIAAGFTGVPNTLLDGTFDDLILSFQEIENATRRLNLGPYGFPEHFQQTGASAYTLDEWFALQSAMWDTRGYHGVIVNFDNGYPYTVGKDLFVGGLASFAVRGKLYTDYVERITITDDSNTRAKAEVMIGDGKSHESPVTRIQRHLTKFEEAINIITMSSN